MPVTNLFTELNAITKMNPANCTSGQYSSGYLSMRDYHQAVAIVMVGAMASNATLDAQLQQAQDAAGTGVKAITGKAITQLTDAGGDENTICVIELKTEELDVDNGFDHIRLLVDIGLNPVFYAGLVLRTEPRFAPVDTSGLTEVVN